MFRRLERAAFGSKGGASAAQDSPPGRLPLNLHVPAQLSTEAFFQAGVAQSIYEAVVRFRDSLNAGGGR